MAKTNPDEGTSTEVSTVSELDRYKQLSLSEIGMEGGVVEASDEEYGLGGDQWGPIIEDKRQLIKVPFLLLAVKWNEGDNGPFVTLFIMKQDGTRYIVNDGSTGIRDQLTKRYEDALASEFTVTERGNKITKEPVVVKMMCRKGFRVSEYNYTDGFGETNRAATYYVDTSL